MAGMRSNFEKSEPNVVARLISMNWCGWPVQKSRLRQHRANARTAKNVAPSSTVDRLARRPCRELVSEGAPSGQRVQENAFHYNPSNYRTVLPPQRCSSNE